MMATVTADPQPPETLAELLERLGDIPPERVRAIPAPGTATEEDVLAIHASENRLFELVDGILVEKGIGYAESMLAAALCALLREFVLPRKLGLVTGADGMLRLFPGLVRIPDVAFASWDRIPGRRVPREPIPNLVPNLAVEVLSESNTEREMQRKVGEYFRNGVELVWLIDPQDRTARVYRSTSDVRVLGERDTLDGGTVLPGFELPLADLFGELDQQG
jgi:Uma2 family endonuclease